MDDLYTKWRTMWDAKEHTTQLFFLANVIIAIYIGSRAFTANAAEGTASKRRIILGLGVGYFILVLAAYFQLVPKVNPYG